MNGANGGSRRDGKRIKKERDAGCPSPIESHSVCLLHHDLAHSAVSLALDGDALAGSGELHAVEAVADALGCAALYGSDARDGGVE